MFGKMIDSYHIQPCPQSSPDGRWSGFDRLPADKLAEYGYYELFETSYPDDGKTYRPFYALETTPERTIIVQGWEEVVLPPPKVYRRRMTQLKIKTFLKSKVSGESNAWSKLKATLEAVDAFDDFALADYLEEDNESLLAFLPVLQPLLDTYAVTLEDLLTVCNDGWWQMQNPVLKEVPNGTFIDNPSRTVDAAKLNLTKG